MPEMPANGQKPNIQEVPLPLAFSAEILKDPRGEIWIKSEWFSPAGKFVGWFDADSAMEYGAMLFKMGQSAKAGGLIIP